MVIVFLGQVRSSYKAAGKLGEVHLQELDTVN